MMFVEKKSFIIRYSKAVECSGVHLFVSCEPIIGVKYSQEPVLHIKQNFQTKYIS